MKGSARLGDAATPACAVSQAVVSEGSCRHCSLRNQCFSSSRRDCLNRLHAIAATANAPPVSTSHNSRRVQSNGGLGASSAAGPAATTGGPSAACGSCHAGPASVGRIRSSAACSGLPANWSYDPTLNDFQTTNDHIWTRRHPDSGAGADTGDRHPDGERQQWRGLFQVHQLRGGIDADRPGRPLRLDFYRSPKSPAQLNVMK